MFSQLKEYEEESFYKEHPNFYIYTPDGKQGLIPCFQQLL